MKLRDRIITLAGGSTIRKRMVAKYAWSQDKADHLAPQIAQLRRAGYEQTLAELAGTLGLDHEPQLRNADVIAGIRRDARGVAFGVLHNHNDDLRQTVASALQAEPPPSQRELSALLRGWEKDRAAYKTAQIERTETSAGRDQALRDVIDRNGFTLHVHAEPKEAQCERCQALVDRGTFPADEAPAMPIHPNCVHALTPDTKSLNAQAQQRGSVWLGGEDEIELAEPAVRSLLALTDAALLRPRRDALLALDAAWAGVAEGVA